MRWTEGHLAASQRPWRRRPRRGRSAWHACGWVSREPGRPRRLHRKDRRGAGTGSPSPRPWTSHLASDGANRRCSDGTAGRRQRSAGGWAARSPECLIVPPKRGELSPRDPWREGGTGRWHRWRERRPTHRGWVPSPRHDNGIAELARQAVGMAVAIAWLPGPAGTRRRVAKLSVEEPDAAEPARPDLWGGQGQQRPWSTRPRFRSGT